MEEGGQVKYANSGGKKREYYQMLARTGRLETSASGSRVIEHVPGWQLGDPYPAHYSTGSASSSSRPTAKAKGASKGDSRSERSREKMWKEL